MKRMEAAPAPHRIPASRASPERRGWTVAQVATEARLSQFEKVA
jgi:hypothetical protein